MIRAIAAPPFFAVRKMHQRSTGPTIAPEPSCVKWWNGPAQTLAKLRGRVVILSLGDPAVVTSKATAPALDKLAGKWKDQPVTIVEVAVTEKEEVVEAWAEKNGGRAVGWDPKGATSAEYPGTSMPRAYRSA